MLLEENMGLKKSQTGTAFQVRYKIQNVFKAKNCHIKVDVL